MIQTNYLKEKITKKKPVIGTWNTLSSPLVTEVLAHSGLDFVIIDFEHAPAQFGQIHDYVNRCEQYQCSPIIRLPSNEDWMILQALDQGAHCVMLPHIDTVLDAKKICNAVKYYPLGKRGYSPFSKSGGFTNVNKKTYSQDANEFSLIAIMIESQEGLNELEAILELPEIDIVYFGAYDLSQALGYPGKINHESVFHVIQEAVSKVISAGKYAGGFVSQSQEDIIKVENIGMNFITYEVECSLLFRAFNEMTNWFKTIHLQ
jgi:4-hydroxy-2-oxoheptanedioate aldolase